MIYYGKTDRGSVRSENQDSFGYEEINLKCIGTTALLAVVCDGMGGVAGGKIASEAASKSFIKYVTLQIEAFDEDLSDPLNIPFEKILRDGVKVANKEILAEAAQNTAYRGMGTTLAAVLCAGNTLYCVNIGDSRIYTLNGNEISQISQDHSYVQTLVDSGKITAEQAKHHPEKNVILKAVGVSAVAEPDVFKCGVPNGILLCSDGLSNMVEDSQIAQALNASNSKESLEREINSLIKAANDAGGSDNITAFAVIKGA